VLIIRLPVPVGCAMTDVADEALVPGTTDAELVFRPLVAKLCRFIDTWVDCNSDLVVVGS
jgi:hypothetical protein